MDSESGAAELPRHAVTDGLAVIAGTLDKLATTVSWSLPDAELRNLVRAGAGLLARFESAWLGLVRDLDGRPGAVPGARAGYGARTFLTDALHRSAPQAGRDVAAALALEPGRDPADGGQPAMAQAFAAGQVSREHVDVAVRVQHRIPRRLLRAVDEQGVSGAARVDAFLAEQSRELPPQATEQLGRQPATEVEDEEGQLTLVADDRTRSQRQADALTAIAQAALAHAGQGTGERPHVQVIANLDQVAAAHALAETGADEPSTPGAAESPACDPESAPRRAGDPESAPQPAAAGTTDASPVQTWAGPTFTAAPGPSRGARIGATGLAHCTLTGPISPIALAYLSCDAVLQAVVLDTSGAVLSLGRTVRTASPAQRRALAARDKGCVVPGCSAPPEHCEAHHVRWWRHDGDTDLDNMALVCPRHHTDIHHGVWRLEMIGGLAWARPPRWLRPDQPLLRNTVHLAMDHARRLGQQLRLDLDDTG